MPTRETADIQSIDHLLLLLLNVGFAQHDGDWNWENVNSPFIRIYYVTEGSAMLHLPSSDYILRPGHMYMIPAFVTHSYSCASVFKHYYMHIYVDHNPHLSMFDDYEIPVEIESDESALALIRRLHCLNPSMQLPGSNPKLYDNRKILTENITRNKARELGLRIESRGILFEIFSKFIYKSNRSDMRGDPRIIHVKNSIGRNLGQALSIERLAQSVYMSTDHFIRLFKKEIGMPPLKYITKKKMEHARFLLLTEETSIKSIAHTLGFDDVSYFIRLFKKELGATPAEYRRNNK